MNLAPGALRREAHALLESRLEAVETALDAAARAEVAVLDPERPTLTTGAGASEAPARLLAWALTEAGHVARFVPLSSFASRGDSSWPRSSSMRLVVVSQGLSPNARLGLARHAEFAETVLVTTIDPRTPRGGSAHRTLTEAVASGARVVRHGPESEDGLLARVVGPSVASVLALRLAGATCPPDLGARRRSALARARSALDLESLALAREGSDAQRIALLTVGSSGPLSHGARWRLLEAAGVVDPPVWDVLQFAHGPFQQIHGRRALLCGLERPGDAPLFDRLEQLLVPERHRLWRVRAELDAPWCVFEHEAAIDVLATTLAEREGHDLSEWPGRGADGPLYELGPDDPDPR